ncbi:unnamed protein product [Closterium sp. Naga37s-1]|nr:unnamed protein product [Closterium sp. Naga37s-1]
MRRVLKVRVGGVTGGQEQVKRRKMLVCDGEDDVPKELGSGGGVMNGEAQQGSGGGVLSEEAHEVGHCHAVGADGEAEEVGDVIGIKWADVDTLFDFDPHPTHAARDDICTEYIRESAVELLGEGFSAEDVVDTAFVSHGEEGIGDARAPIQGVAELGDESGFVHIDVADSAMGRSGKRWQERKSGKRSRDEDGEDVGGTDTSRPPFPCSHCPHFPAWPVRALPSSYHLPSFFPSLPVSSLPCLPFLFTLPSPPHFPLSHLHYLPYSLYPLLPLSHMSLYPPNPLSPSPSLPSSITPVFPVFPVP